MKISFLIPSVRYRDASMGYEYTRDRYPASLHPKRLQGPARCRRPWPKAWVFRAGPSAERIAKAGRLGILAKSVRAACAAEEQQNDKGDTGRKKRHREDRHDSAVGGAA